MRAAILVEQHRELVLDEIELPEDLDRGQVLVRVHYAGVCGSQVGEIDGVKGADPHLPHLLGHEGSGTVVRVGDGVRRVAAGDRVVLHWCKAAGIDAPTPLYKWRGRRLNAGWVTTFNECAIVSENRVTPIARDVDPQAAVLLGCAATTGLGVVANDARVRPGESVAVVGCGGVGMFVVQGAAAARARPIVAFDRSAAKLELARRLGATHTIDTGRVEIVRALRELLPGGADVVVENTGHTHLIEAGYEMCAPQGRTVLVGVPRAGDRARIDTLPLHFGKRLVGSYGGGTIPDRDIPRYVESWRAGALDLNAAITERTDLQGINEALRRLRAGEIVGRCLVEISAPL